jgi:hypothetical protein
MNYQNFKTGHDKASKFTAEQYGTKVSVEVDHSDMDLDEVMDAFQTLIIGMGYHENSFKNWVIDRADEYRETDAEELKEKLDAWKFEEDYTGQFEDWKNETPTIEDDEETSNKRMDIIGQNGNEGLHYRATEEDESEFDDYGARIVTDSSFEWDDEAENDVDLFEGDTWFANDNLKEANEKYKKALKTLSAKQKKKSK